MREEGQWLITGRFLQVPACPYCNGPVQEHISVDPEDESKLWACTCGRTFALQLPDGKIDFT